MFLTYRSLVNALKRSLTSPKRLITTLIIVGYYFWWFVRPIIGGSVTLGAGGRFQPRFEFPALELLEAVVFSAFAGLSLLLALSMFSYKSNFKPADVDVLFPTPVNPKVVLLFRVVRDYLATLLVPLFLIIFTWKPLRLEEMFLNVPHPQSAGYAFRALTLGFLLVTTAWVGIGYAMGLYINRNDRLSETRKRIVTWGISIACMALVGYIGYHVMQFKGVGDFISFAQQDWLRVVFFTATPATNVVMGPLEGDVTETLVGISILVGISGLSLYLALRQADWMYDQAAVRGFGSESIRQLQRQGDVVGVMAEAARRGKTKVRKPGWFQRLNTRGFGALLWKDALIQWRSIRALVLLFTAMGIMLIVLPYVFGGGPRRSQGIGYIILIMEGFLAFSVASMIAQSGFTELLRRVDLQKPLPFGPQRIVLSEVLAKALPAMLIPVLCSLLGLILFPVAWREVIAGAIFFPSLATVVCALVCVIVLLFPEVDDVSQRGFRGIMMLLGLLVVGAPGVLVFALVTAFTKTIAAGAVPAAGMNYAIAFGLTAIGGALYAGFNPSE